MISRVVAVLLFAVVIGCQSSTPPSPVPPQVNAAPVSTPTPPAPVVVTAAPEEKVKPRVWAPPVEKGYAKPEKKERWLEVKLYDGGGVAVPCDKCGGLGMFRCSTCSGTGSVLRPTGFLQPVSGKILTEAVACPTCKGAGGRTCAVCKGSGKQIERG